MTIKRRAKPRNEPATSPLILPKREIGAAEFKAHCLELMDQVDRLGVEVVITKHRKPIARLVPVEKAAAPFCGWLRDVITFEGDVISPIDVPWDAQNA